MVKKIMQLSDKKKIILDLPKTVLNRMRKITEETTLSRNQILSMLLSDCYKDIDFMITRIKETKDDAEDEKSIERLRTSVEIPEDCIKLLDLVRAQTSMGRSQIIILLFNNERERDVDYCIDRIKEIGRMVNPPQL